MVVIVVVIVALLLGLAWTFQRRLIYLPATAPVPRGETVLPAARDVVLYTSDGLDLGAWFIPAGEPNRGFTVLVANGNAGDRGARAPLAAALAEEGLSVLLFDYRGYGGNPGSPSEEGLSRDIRAARAYLVEDVGVPPTRLLYLGESLGAAVVTELASEYPPAGMVLRSPFVDLATVGEVHYGLVPVRLLLWDKYPLVEHLADVKAPVTIVYGTEDSIIPPDQSRAVAAAAPLLEEIVEVVGADHNDPELVAGELLTTATVRMSEQAER